MNFEMFYFINRYKCQSNIGWKIKNFVFQKYTFLQMKKIKTFYAKNRSVDTEKQIYTQI